MAYFKMVNDMTFNAIESNQKNCIQSSLSRLLTMNEIKCENSTLRIATATKMRLIKTYGMNSTKTEKKLYHLKEMELKHGENVRRIWSFYRKNSIKCSNSENVKGHFIHTCVYLFRMWVKHIVDAAAKQRKFPKWFWNWILFHTLNGYCVV